MSLDYFCDLHSNCIFHGDIKPENIFMFSDFLISSDGGSMLILNNEDTDSQY